MINRILLLFAFFVLPLAVFCQEEEEEEDETKMVREVVNVMVDKAKYAAPVVPKSETTTGGKKKKKKQQVEEPPPADTGASTIPAPATELFKRGQIWAKTKFPKYKKTNAATSGSNITCTAVFPYKQKILNPENLVDGEIHMNVIIEAKEGKYRYTIKNIKHVASRQGMSGGDIFLQVPECGSMKITDQTWKQIRSAARGNIQVVVDELKEKMKHDSDKKKDEW